MKNKGWIKLYRGQFFHWISKKPWCDGYAWCYLYSQANHKPGMINFRNEYIKIDRGQFLTSKKKLQKLFGWTRTHINNFILGLNADHMITYRTTHRYTLITIDNYRVYQDKVLDSGTQNDPQLDIQTTYRRPTDDHKQECIKNDLRKIKKLSNLKIEKDRGKDKDAVRSRKLFLDIVKKEKEGG